MSSRPELKLDWCSHEAAKYAVEKWHYSKSLPPPPRNAVGVWESGIFRGVIVFGRGAAPDLLKPYGLKLTDGCELVRIALGGHEAPVSQIVAIGIRMLRKHSPGLRLIVSFADPGEGHHGGIYQAGGWLYAGLSASSTEYIDKNGKRWHGRMVHPSGKAKCYGKHQSVPKPDQCQKVTRPGKHRYLMPLDPEMRARIEPLRKPYPKRASEVND